MTIDSAPFSIRVGPIGGTSLLAQTAAALGDNEWVQWIDQPRPPPTDGLAWQTAWFYDPMRGLAHLLYKQANENADWQHWIYDEAAHSAGSSAWRSGGLNGATINLPGHIYGNSALDPATGDLYLQTYDQPLVRRWTAATQAWDFQTSAFQVGTVTAPINGIVWHPNLFGPGDGGIVWCGSFTTTAGSFRAWRKADNSWISLGSFTRTANRYHGQGAYITGWDRVILGSCDSITLDTRQTPRLVLPGNPPTHIDAALAPLDMCTGDMSRMPMGPVIQHPRDPAKALLVQRVALDPPNGGNGTWTSNNGITWTAGPSHPWPERAFVACSIPKYGVVWFIGDYTSILWKPPA